MMEGTALTPHQHQRLSPYRLCFGYDTCAMKTCAAIAHAHTELWLC